VTLATRSTRVDADRLISRVAALRRFLAAVTGCVPEERLTVARSVVARAGERLALSRDHTVVALAGATGSGKSSLFNALAGLQLSKVGVRRPTTGLAHACTWGPESAKPLLDWLAVPTGRRFTRESPLDGDDEAALRGLVLLDLPDFDSVLESHRVEVDRLLELVDLVVWVLDPQKYADKVVHRQYLAEFAGHQDVTVVLLNQADRLSPADTDRIVDDLRGLLVTDGLDGVPVLTTSAVSAPGTGDLRELLERAVATRQAMLNRLAADVTAAAAELAPLVAVPASGVEIDRGSVRRLSDALADAAGVPAVVAATEQGYRHRAAAAIGWPLLRWVRRLRPDPLRRLHLPGPRTGVDQPARTPSPNGAAPATSLPTSTAAEKAAVALAGRAVADQATRVDSGIRLPEPWPDTLLHAARSRLNDVPDALDVAITRTDLGLTEARLWWRAVGWLQWAGALVALVGLTWLAVRYAMFALGLPELPTPEVGILPLPTVLLAGGLLFGLLLAIVVRPFVRMGARRARRSADRKLRNAVTNVANEMIVGPVRQVLRVYGEAREALAVAQLGR
jgi:energy-coupling factor transporter ATP-binding protein EcfA2